MYTSVDANPKERLPSGLSQGATGGRPSQSRDETTTTSNGDYNGNISVKIDGDGNIVICPQVQLKFGKGLIKCRMHYNQGLCLNR